MIDHERLKQLLAQGLSHAEAAKALGCTRPAVTRVANKHGYQSTKQRKLVDAEQLRVAVANGISFSEFARNNGFEVGVVSAAAKRNNILPPGTNHLAHDIPAKFYERYVAGVSLNQLHKESDIPVATLKRAFKRIDHDIKFRTHDEAVRPALLNDSVLLGEAASTKSYRAIARELGTSVRTVTDAARRFHLPFLFSKTWNTIDSERLADMYLVRLMNPSAIAAELQYPYGVILKQLKRLGFPIGKPGGQTKPSKYPQLNDTDWLHKQYLTRGVGSIAEEIGAPLGLIRYHLRRHNIAIRSKEEVMIILMEHAHGVREEYRGIKCHSALEVSFLKSLPESAVIQRNVRFEYANSMCFIDFMVDEELIEVKPKEVLCQAGPDRRRMIKQAIICKHNRVDMKVWTKAGYWDGKITDDDILHAMNWKLFFQSADECHQWLVERGFTAPRYGLLELADAAVKMNLCKSGEELNANFNNHHPAKLMYHFFPHFWQSSHKDYMSVSSVWEPGNRSVLRAAVHKLWDNKREVSIYGLLKCIRKFYKDFTTVSWFKPWIAGYIYDKYLPNSGVVVDPCCGWGGRLMGTVDKPIKYIGYDINASSIDAHLQLTKFLGSRLKLEPEFFCADSSTATFAGGDLLFTSPPYDDAEYYHGTAGCTPTTDILQNIFRQFKGIVALNIPKWLDDETVAIAGQHGRRLRERLEMKTSSFMGRERTSEPILVF